MLKGASLLVDAVITQTGYSGQTVTLDVEDDGRIVGSQKVQLPADGSPATVRVRATASEAGPARVHVQGRAAAGRGRDAEQPARRRSSTSATRARRFSTSKASRAPR